MDKRSWIIVAIVLILGLGLTVYFHDEEQGVPEVLTQSDLDVSAPAQQDYTYKHDIGFTVLVPRGWRVAERYDSQNLEVVVYPGMYAEKVPAAFSTRPHVSIFPYGTGSGGDLPWAAATSSPINSNDGADTRQFITKGGDVWGWTIMFRSIPEGSQWRSWGVVYASVDMIQADPICESASGEAKDELLCSQLQGDVLYRMGRISRDEEATLARILRSIDLE
jgi:hypothetical protein